MNIYSFLSFAFIISFTPGPNNILCMTFGRQYGYKKALKYILGVAGGFFTLFIITLIFNKLLLDLFPQIELVMKYFGAIFLVYLSYAIIYSSNDHSENIEKYASFKAGFFIQFINPKGLLAALTITSNFLLKNYSQWSIYLLTGVFLSAMAFSATSTWAAAGTFIQKFLNKFSQQFNFTMGLLLIYCALTILGVKWS